MAHNDFIRAGGAWTTSRLLPAEVARFDLAQKQAINGDDGGVWAPGTQIVLGGAGLRVDGPFAAGASGGDPIFHVSGQAASLNGGGILTVEDDAEIHVPGSGLWLTDTTPVRYQTARTFTNRAVPFAMMPVREKFNNPALSQSLPTPLEAPYADEFGFVNFSGRGLVVLMIDLPPGAVITRIAVVVKGSGRPADFNFASGDRLRLGRAEHTGTNLATGGSQTGPTPLLDPSTTGALYNAYHTLALTTSNGGLPPGGLIVQPTSRHGLILDNAYTGGPQYPVRVSGPFVDGSITSERVVLECPFRPIPACVLALREASPRLALSPQRAARPCSCRSTASMA